jgi:ElaB/YqjD/DUF883 family membrane-anchored ribosome-binding protein
LLEDEPEKFPDTQALLVQLQETLDAARSMPLSASVMVNREEFGEILHDAIDGLPEELRQARWLLKERDEVLERAAQEAERIIDVARVRAERMVERTEVVREARRAAEDTVNQAAKIAAQMRLEAEDYVDRKLAAFEVVLDRTMQQVVKGRERLSVHAPTHEDLLGPEAEEAEQAFFDQDE